MHLPHWARSLRVNVHGIAPSPRRRSAIRRRSLSAVEALEDRTLLAADFGDAPDLGVGTGVGDYQTTLADNGPSHTIVAGLFMGASVDAEADGLPTANANGDDVDGALPIDEDGLSHPASDLALTIGGFPSVTVRVTNTTGTAATLYGWIDTNADGVFDNATERASIAVPDGTSSGLITLTFPQVLTGFTGTTYARFRLSTDTSAANPTGAATDGEVEDHRATITEPTNGTVASQSKIASGVGGFGTLDYNDRFGSSAIALGDLDSDGVTDMVVGAPRDDTGTGSDKGAVYILLMNANGTVKNSVKVADNTGGLGAISGFASAFGSSLTSLGDLDGDGIVDLAVGAPYDDTGGTNRGAVYVLFLNGDGTVKSSQRIADGLSGFSGLADNDEFGSSVSSIGDLDGDGVTDLAVGARSDDSGAFESGAAHILFLNSDGTVKGSQKIAEGVGGFGGLANSDNFGVSIASLGDLNGDGLTDVAVGAHRDDTGGSTRGAVHVLFLNANGSVQSHQKIADNTGGFGSLLNGVQFGYSLGALGDLDGNGVADLAVGAFGDDTGGSDKGAVYVLLMNPNGSVKASQKIADNTGGFGTVDGRYLGGSVTNLGDLDGNGLPDLAIGAVGISSAIDGEGAVYVTSLGAGPPAVASIALQMPESSPTNADQVTFRVAFSEAIVNIDTTDFLLSGTAAGDGSVDSVFPGPNATEWDVIVTGLTNSNGTINLDFAGGQDIEDLFGNALVDTTPTSFEEEYLLDNVPPVIQTLSPADDFLLAATHTDLVITFDEAMQKGSGNIVIKRISDDSVFETIDVSDAAVTVAGAVVTIDPPNDFTDATEYYVQVDAGAFEDLAGNPFAGIADTATWNFTAILQTLTFSFADSSVSEAGGPMSTTATVSRNGDPTAALEVTLTNPDDTELFLPITVTIPAGATFFDFDIETVNDGDLDGDQTGLVVTAAATGYIGADDTIDVLDDDTAVDRTLGGHLYGTISSETYRVLHNITVDANRTLVIEPASTLQFMADTGLTIHGTLTADGDAGSEIVFTSVAGTPAPGDWSGLLLQAPSMPRSVLDYIEVAYAELGVDVYSVNDPHVTLSNSDIHHSEFDGVRSAARHRQFIDGDDFRLEGNSIHDNGGVGVGVTAQGSSNNQGIGSRNTMNVIGNEIYNNAGFGISIGASYSAIVGLAASVSASPNVEGNLIYDNGGGIHQSAFETSGAFGSGSANAIIYNNLIANNTGRGIELEVSGTGNVTPRLVNNTIIGNGGAGLFHEAVLRPLNGQGILNNIIAGNGTGIEADGAHTPTVGVVGFNNVFDNAGGNWINYPVSFGDLTGTGPTGLPADAENNVSVDPQFVSASNYHLQGISPMINAGNSTNSLIPATDFDGDTRKNPDIGFDEYFAEVIDDGDPGFAIESGAWGTGTAGANGDNRNASQFNGSKVASWTFDGLTPGVYRVSATWAASPVRATDAPFTVLDGVNPLATIDVNQQLAPSGVPGVNDLGVSWQDLGNDLFRITGNTLKVELSNDANGYVMADAVRIERIGELPPPPVIVDDGDPGFAIESGSWGTGNAGANGDNRNASIFGGTKVARWSFDNLTPGVYRVSTTWLPSAARATDAPFTLFDGFTPITTVDVNQQLAPSGSPDLNDLGVPWQDLAGNFQVTGDKLFVKLTNIADGYVMADAIRIERVADFPQVIDDGDAGFAIESGTWGNGNVGTFGDNRNASIWGGHKVASWTFTGLTAGTYRVSATWAASLSRATDAPYTILDGATSLTTIDANQQQAPDDLTEGGIDWEDLTTVLITGDTLVVQLSNDANNYVMADAIRIQRVES
ncbi:MAG: FG-GAP repeat protein [Planctomycetaceae bacterium]|nr:FG-GAP repeat protein [Planctomycetaceae bacterium]